MSDTLRTFIALPVPPSPRLLRHTRELDQFRPRPSSVNPGQWHITLKFLGPVSAADILLVTAALERALAGMASFVCTLTGLGAFPTLRRPGVVWAGVANTGPLCDLAARVEAACVAAGQPAESRRFHPHLTLARLRGRPPAGLADWVQTSATTHWGEFTAQEVVLFESRAGAGYVPLATFPLK